jgi:hypothetical protein
MKHKQRRRIEQFVKPFRVSDGRKYEEVLVEKARAALESD